MSQYQLFTAERRGNAWVVAIAADRIVDDPQTDELRKELAAFIKEVEPVNVVVDLSKVSLVSSAGLAFFQHLSRAVAARHGYAAFCAVQPDVLAVFHMVGLDMLFPVFDGAEAAAAAFD